MRKDLLSPILPSAWDERTARHLLNRAGFGVPRERVAHLTRIGPTAAVNEMVDYETAPSDIADPGFLPESESYREKRAEFETLDPEERKRARQEFVARERATVIRLGAWWIERMASTPRPLEEKMTLFWHGHFATSAQKVRASRFNYGLNAVFREHAAGNFKVLTTAVGQSPAMLRYLDNIQNVKGRPNENWARELMELFTMGAGNYTEQDIKESARAFTGWMSNGPRFVFNRRRHDFEQKTFMGRTGTFDGWDILDIIFEQAATARFICRKLFEFFAYSEPEPEIVEALASNLRFNNYELRPVLRQLFRSKVFYSDKAIGTQIKSPAQFMIQLADDLNLHDPPQAAMARLAGDLGQRLFFPPNVAGWEGGRAWINTNTLLMRYNMPKTLVAASFVETDDMSMMMRVDERRRLRQEAFRSHFEAYLEGLPRVRRRQIRVELRGLATPVEKTAYIQEKLFTASSGDRWDLEALYADLEFGTAQECAEALADRFLSVPLSKNQQKRLAQGLSGERSIASPLTLHDLDAERMSGALHLVLSLAEYQLS